MHIWAHHVCDQVREHGNIAYYNQEAVERYDAFGLQLLHSIRSLTRSLFRKNHTQNRVFFNATCHNGQDALQAIMMREHRLMVAQLDCLTPEEVARLQ